MKKFTELKETLQLNEYKFAIGAKAMMADLERCVKQSDPSGYLAKGLAKDSGLNFNAEFRKMQRLLIEAADIYENVMADVEDSNDTSRVRRS